MKSPPGILLAAAATVAALVLLPLLWTALQALQSPPAQAAALLLRPLVAELLLNTLAITLAATLLAGLIGTLCALAIERTDLPCRGLWTILAAIPLAIPPFVSSYGWISLSPRLEGFAGALIVVASAYMPLVFLPVAAALRGIDPAQEETARALGLSPLSCFFRVVLPQLRPALLGGMLLVALDTLVEFGAFTLLRFRTFTTQLFVAYRTGAPEWQTAIVAIVLVLLCMICLAAEWRVRGPAHIARIGRFTARRASPARLGRWTLPVLAGFTLLGLATLGVPLGMILFWLLQHDGPAISPSLASWGRVAAAFAASLRLGLLGASVTLVLALPLGALAARYRGRVVTLLERAAYLAQGVPGIVIALALISLSLQAVPFLYQSQLLLALAYAIVFLPLALVSVRAALIQAPSSLDEAGRALGLGRAATAWRVTLPLAAPGLGAAAALVFVSIVTELTSTLLLAPIGTRTLATELWSDTTTLAFASAAPYAACMALLSLVSTWVLATRFGGQKKTGRMFFFGKKNQKTLVRLAAVSRQPPNQDSQKFLASFFQKGRPVFRSDV